VSIRVLHYSDIENAYDEPGRVGKVASVLRARRTPETVVVGSGDNTGPGVLSLVTDGRVSIPFFERVSPDVETFGNHDLDHGLPGTRSIVDESPQTWVNANLHHDGDRLGADVGTVPSTVIDANGYQVGVTGVVTPDLPEITPAVDGVTVGDPTDAAQQAVDRLRDQGVDAVIVLAHIWEDTELAAAVDADLVASGHVHDARTTTVGDTVVTRPGSGGHVVYEIELGDDPSVKRHEVTKAPADAPTVQTLQTLAEEEGLTEPVSTVAEPIERGKHETLGGESRIGNLVTDAYRYVTGADVGLQNGGGIRTGPPLSGEITVGDLIGIVPFEEDVVVAELSGEELRSILREGSAAVHEIGDPWWWNAHVSGVEAVWNRAERTFERLHVGGRPIDPDATYTLATSEYLLTTSLEFPTLTESHRIRAAGRQYDALVAYAQDQELDPEIEDRLVRREIDCLPSETAATDD
jgi:2',3'-cyclic-nucleotide 2'-phosphodiesterase (5'-nucleotidase family)